MKNLQEKLFLLFVLLFLIVPSCVVNPVTGRKDLMLLSEDQEKAMGLESDPQITAFYGMYDDPALQAFIDEKGSKMAALSHRPGLGYDFKILDSPVVNAFAVPGGYVYFTRGIMAHFNNEAEFAGVLGHEIGHITARHSARQYSSQMLAQLGVAVGMAVSEQFRQYSDIALQGVSLLFLKFSRDHESESDVLGVEYSSKLGYDANEMAGFFQTLNRLSEGSEAANLPSFLSTHPHPLDREAHVKKLAAEWQQRLSLTDPVANRNNYLKMIDGLVYGNDPKQGYVENSIFYHPVLKFQYPIPTGWDYSNTTTQVQMAPQGGKALLILTLAQGQSLREAAQAFLKNHQLQLIDAYEAKVRGLPALELYADQVSDQQQQQQSTVRLISYLILYNELIYQFIGLSSVNDFNGFLPTFHRSITNFKPLTDPQKINVKPDRIRIKTVGQNMTFGQALQSFGVKSDQMKQLAILNSMQLTDRLVPGTMVKIISK
jgi:predicted Zn-dependent protease